MAFCIMLLGNTLYLLYVYHYRSDSFQHIELSVEEVACCDHILDSPLMVSSDLLWGKAGEGY